MPNEAFSLWNIIRDVFDPAPDSEKVHLKGDSEENAVAKPASESKRVTFKEENEDETLNLRKMRKTKTCLTIGN